MADRALTREAVLSGLQDIRLPVDAPGGILAEALAALGLGLLLALAIGSVLRALTLKAPSRTASAPAPPELSDEARRLALLGELKRRKPERFAALAEGLYRPGGLPDAAKLEAELSAP